MGGRPLPTLAGLPGADLVEQGVDDLGAGRDTVEAALVTMAAPRLRSIGIEVPDGHEGNPGHRLYALLAAADGAGAHSRYNALVGRITSLARAAEHARSG